MEEKYKNLLDVVNDLRKRVKSLEIQNQSGTIQPGMMGSGILGPGPMSKFHRNIQPTNMKEMNQPPITSQIPPNPQTSASSKHIDIKFLFKDIEFLVQGKNDMNVKNLIICFRIKLCDPDIKIEKYLILPTRVELDPNSIEALASKGITEGTIINAVSK